MNHAQPAKEGTPMRYCPKCASVNPDDMAFCPRCGTSMEYAPYARAAANAGDTRPDAALPAEDSQSAPAQDAILPEPAIMPPPAPQKTNVSTVWMILNITATVVCCPGFLFSVPGIIFAALGSESFKRGDTKDAGNKSIISMVFFILGVLAGLAGWIAVLVMSLRRYRYLD
jgi:hypothetical protein